MRTIKYELKKIFTHKAYWIAFALMILILIGNELTPMILGNFRHKMDTEIAVSGTVLDDTYFQSIKGKDLDSADPTESFVKLATGKNVWNGESSDDFYKQRVNVVERLMRDDKISDDDITYWKQWDSSIETPYVYQYAGAYNAFLEICSFMNFMILILIAIGASGIFAGEKLNNTDQLIFCTKYGRTKLYAVKLLSGIILGIFTSVILLGFELCLLFGIYGTSGFNTIIQFSIPTSMMNLTVGKAMLIIIGNLLFESIILSVIAMMVSQLSMNLIVTTASMFLVMFMAMFTLPSSYGWLYVIWNTIPGASAGAWLFYDYHLISLLGNKFTVSVYLPTFWAIYCLIFVKITLTSYIRYQIKAR